MMYFKTLEEESNFLQQLWEIFDNWDIQKSGDEDVKESMTEVVKCDLICPKCGSGRILNYGIISTDKNGLHSYGMKHFCDSCGEVFDRIKISEDIYQHTPHKMLNCLDTPLGKFEVLRNGQPIMFRYRVLNNKIDNVAVDTHLVDVDTSKMEKGDIVFAGIRNAGFEYLDGDEKCSYRSAENEDYFLVLNGEEINDMEVDVQDYTFITEGSDGDGYEYLVHQEPENLKNEISHFSRVITLSLAWLRKNTCENYEEIVEQAAW